MFFSLEWNPNTKRSGLVHFKFDHEWSSRTNWIYYPTECHSSTLVFLSRRPFFSQGNSFARFSSHLLQQQDPQIIQVCLDALQNMLKQASTRNLERLKGEIEECGGKRTRKTKSFILPCFSFQGLDKIENLQNHSNTDIYHQAYEIIDKYFSNDLVNICPFTRPRNKNLFFVLLQDDEELFSSNDTPMSSIDNQTVPNSNSSPFQF